jgi:hypothetical protein
VASQLGRPASERHRGALSPQLVRTAVRKRSRTHRLGPAGVQVDEPARADDVAFRLFGVLAVVPPALLVSPSRPSGLPAPLSCGAAALALKPSPPRLRSRRYRLWCRRTGYAGSARATDAAGADSGAATSFDSFVALFDVGLLRICDRLVGIVVPVVIG